DIGDCLTKCGSAFESVLKVICTRKGWNYKQTDTAKTLLDIILPHTNLDSYFGQVLIIVATLRNRLKQRAWRGHHSEVTGGAFGPIRTQCDGQRDPSDCARDG